MLFMHRISGFRPQNLVLRPSSKPRPRVAPELFSPSSQEIGDFFFCLGQFWAVFSGKKHVMLCFGYQILQWCFFSYQILYIMRLHNSIASPVFLVRKSLSSFSWWPPTRRVDLWWFERCRSTVGFERFPVSKFCWLHSLKLTANAAENRVIPKGNDHIPTIHCQVRTVSFREGIPAVRQFWHMKKCNPSMEKKTNTSLMEFLEDRKNLAIDGEEGQLLELTFKGGETRVVYAPQKGELVSSQRWEMLGHAVKSFFARVKMGSKVFWVQGQWGLIPFWRACRRISRGIFRVPGRGDPCPAAATTCGWHSKKNLFHRDCFLFVSSDFCTQRWFGSESWWIREGIRPYVTVHGANVPKAMLAALGETTRWL